MDGIRCPNCGAINPVGFKFCGQCGARLDVETSLPPEPAPPPMAPPVAPPPAAPAPSARLVVIESDGTDGESYEIPAGASVVLGRTEGDIVISKDPYLSPRHVSFTHSDGKVVVEDLGSLNGVFVKITEPTPIEFGDMFLVGRHFFRVDRPEDLSEWYSVEDGTYLFYTSQSPVPFLLVEILDGGFEGTVYRPVDGILTIGRENNLVNIENDKFVSSHHAILKEEAGRIVLVDQGSKNGTFVRMKGRTELASGDFVFVGSALMRIDIA